MVDKYTLSVHPKPQRILLLSPKEHMTNNQMLRKPEFWRMALGLLRTMPHSTMVANLGKWETANSKDDSAWADYCHAHAQFQLTEREQKQLCQHWLALRGHNQPAEDYRRKNLQQLLVDRVMPAQVKKLSTVMPALQVQVARLQDQVNSLQDSLNTLNTSMAAILNRL